MTVAELIAFLKQIQSEKSNSTKVFLRVADKDFEIQTLLFSRDKPVGVRAEDTVYICARKEYPGVL